MTRLTICAKARVPYGGLIVAIAIVAASLPVLADGNVEDDPGVQHVAKAIRDFAKDQNRSMTVEEFQMQYIKGFNDGLVPKDADGHKRALDYLLGVLHSTRRPGKYSLKEIGDAYKFRRDAITSISIEMSIVTKCDLRHGKGLVSEPYVQQVNRVRFAQKGEKLFREESSESIRETGGEVVKSVPYRKAFDGRNEFTVLQNHGQVSSTMVKQDYYQMDYWPSIAALLGSRDGQSAVGYYGDLAALVDETPGMVYIEPELADVDGVKAAVVRYGIPDNTVIYLDPNRGFAVIKATSVDREGDSIIYNEKTYSDFSGDPNSLYLPRRVVLTRAKWNPENHNREVFLTREYTAEKLEVNGPIDEQLFTAAGNFRTGLPIMDVRLGMNYMFGLADAPNGWREMDERLQQAVSVASHVDQKTVAQAVAGTGQEVIVVEAKRRPLSQWANWIAIGVGVSVIAFSCNWWLHRRRTQGR